MSSEALDRAEQPNGQRRRLLPLVVVVVILAACGGGRSAAPAGSAPITTTPATATAPGETTPGDAASGGQPDAIHITVPIDPVDYNEPVDLDQPGDFGDGITVEVIDVEPINVTSALPGEVGGAAVILTLQFTSESPTAVDLDTVIVDLAFDEIVSASPVTTPPAEPIHGELAPGDTVVGRYVFSLPLDKRSDVRLTVSHSAQTPTIVFTGSVAG